MHHGINNHERQYVEQVTVSSKYVVYTHRTVNMELAVRGNVLHFFDRIVRLYFQRVKFFMTTGQRIGLATRVMAARTIMAMTIRVWGRCHPARQVLTFIRLFTRLVMGLNTVYFKGGRLTYNLCMLVDARLRGIVRASRITVSVNGSVAEGINIRGRQPNACGELGRAFTLKRVPFGVVGRKVLTPYPLRGDTVFLRTSWLVAPSPTIRGTPATSDTSNGSHGSGPLQRVALVASSQPMPSTTISPANF